MRISADALAQIDTLKNPGKIALGSAATRLGFKGIITGSKTHNFGSLVDAAGETTTVTVTGAALGDMVIGVSLGVDLQGMTLTGYVSAADTVAVRLQNESGGTLDLASTTLKVAVLCL